MKTKIHKTIRINAEINSLIEAYRAESKSSFSEALEILVLKGLENSHAINNLKQLIRDEMKGTREEIRNQGNRIAGININHFKFAGRIYSHTFSMFKELTKLSTDEINGIENHGINKSLVELKTKNVGEAEWKTLKI